jgi:hypothetical protein
VKPPSWLAALALLGTAFPAFAGPPYKTDDPEPTDLGKWEIYSFVDFDGRHSDLDGEAGFDLNYGAAQGLQLTATLPVAFEHSSESGWQSGRGDVELGAKYRFVDDTESGWQVAAFPRVIVPTTAKHLSGNHARLLLPVWAQKDFGKTSVFGGGGYEINPGSGNRNFWQAGVAVTRDLTDKLQIGGEVSAQSADSRGGKGSTGVELGMINKLGGPYSLLVAGGPSFSGGQASYHGYVALGLNF